MIKSLKTVVLALLLLLVGQDIHALRGHIETFAPGIGKSRPWLSLIVRFDDKSPQVNYESYFNHLSSHLSPHIIGTIKSSKEILFKLKERSITKAEAQAKIDETNLFFDPIEIEKREKLLLQRTKEKAEKEAAVAAHNNIDQNEYHNLVLKCHAIMRECTKIDVDILRKTVMRIKVYKEGGIFSNRIDKLNDDIVQMIKQIYGKTSGKKAVVRFLSRRGTLTSLRLLDDLQASDFALIMGNKLMEGTDFRKPAQ